MNSKIKSDIINYLIGIYYLIQSLKLISIIKLINLNFVEIL